MTLELPTDAGLILLPLARSAIAHRLGLDHPAVVERAAWLEEPGASFVTLTSGRLPGGPLRGCIGTLQAHRPLRDDVEANAVAAATRGPSHAHRRSTATADSAARRAGERSRRAVRRRVRRAALASTTSSTPATGPVAAGSGTGGGVRMSP